MPTAMLTNMNINQSGVQAAWSKAREFMRGYVADGGVIFNRGRVATDYPQGCPVTIVSLGSFAMPAAQWERIGHMTGERLNGRPTRWEVQIIDGIAYGQQVWDDDKAAVPTK